MRHTTEAPLLPSYAYGWGWKMGEESASFMEEKRIAQSRNRINCTPIQKVHVYGNTNLQIRMSNRTEYEL